MEFVLTMPLPFIGKVGVVVGVVFGTIRKGERKMAASKTIKQKGTTFLLYEKSIRIDGIAEPLFFNRKVGSIEVNILAKLLTLGAKIHQRKIRAKQAELKELIHGRLELS
jgi:hypothetical protein